MATRKGVTGKEFTPTSWKTEIAKCKRARTTWTPRKRRTGEAIPRAAKFGKIDNRRAQSLNWDLWIGKQSPIRYRGKIWQLKDPWWNRTSQDRHGIIEKSKSTPHRSIFLDCWMKVCWIEVKSFALLLQSTNQTSKLIETTKTYLFK